MGSTRPSELCRLVGFHALLVLPPPADFQVDSSAATMLRNNLPTVCAAVAPTLVAAHNAGAHQGVARSSSDDSEDESAAAEEAAGWEGHGEEEKEEECVDSQRAAQRKGRRQDADALGEYVQCGAMLRYDETRVGAGAGAGALNGSGGGGGSLEWEGAGGRAIGSYRSSVQDWCATMAECALRSPFRDLGWDREGVGWVPAHRRAMREFGVEVLPRNLMTLLRSAAAGLGGADVPSGRSTRGPKGPKTGGGHWWVRHLLVLFNDSVMLVRELASTSNPRPPALAGGGQWQAVCYACAEAPSQECAGIACRDGKGGWGTKLATKLATKNATIAMGSEAGSTSRSAAVNGVARHRVGAWLRREAEEAARQLELQSSTHRWYCVRARVFVCVCKRMHMCARERA
jgi:hypothetical protein